MRFPFFITLAILAAYGFGLYVTVPANPEVRFWREVVERRDSGIAEIRKERPGTPLIFFTGGSSCAFSIDPKVVEETCGLPAFNLGLPVSAGPKYFLHQALERAHQGDVLVICIEPDLLTFDCDFAPSTFTLAMALLDGNPAATVGGSSFGEHLQLREYLNYSRPGPRYLSTWIAKTLVNKGYRYTSKDIRHHGHIETPLSKPDLPRVGEKLVNSICPSGEELLLTFKAAASGKGVRLIYSMPWVLTAENYSAQNKSKNLKILASINPIISTIDDGYQGVSTDPTCFSDSSLHLTAKGSKLRSTALAEALHTALTQPKR